MVEEEWRCRLPIVVKFMARGPVLAKVDGNRMERWELGVGSSPAVGKGVASKVMLLPSDDAISGSGSQCWRSGMVWPQPSQKGGGGSAACDS